LRRVWEVDVGFRWVETVEFQFSNFLLVAGGNMYPLLGGRAVLSHRDCGTGTAAAPGALRLGARFVRCPRPAVVHQ
jgi:hypothetical protein